MRFAAAALGISAVGFAAAGAGETPQASAAARPPSAPEGAEAGVAAGEARESRWGPIEEPNGANTKAFESEGDSGWARAVDLPYRIAFFPLKVVVAGLEETIGLYQSDFVQRAVHFFPLEVGGSYLSGGVGFGSQEGFSGNVSLDRPRFLRDGGFLKIRLAGTTRGEGKATLGVIHPRSPTSWIQVGGGYRSDLNARFYGLGPGGHNSDRRSFYREEMSWIGLSYKRMIGATNFSFEISANYSGVAANGTNESDEPQLSERFEQELASGSIPELSAGYRDRSDGPTFSLELAHDDTKIRDRPETGGLRRAKVSLFQEKGDDRAEFRLYRGELQQFLPLWFTSRALALRGFFSYIDDTGAEPVPFQRLLTNDDPDLFRGFEDYRFRDKGIWGATVEYRWPVWSNRDVEGIGVDAYGFVDVGQVFGELRDATDDVTTSYGGGFRIGGFGAFAGRIEVGTIEEDTIFRLRDDQVFQFEKAGLFHGRNPVPER
jgi:hypothetical protein